MSSHSADAQQIAIVGPTASGKSRLALEIANEVPNIEIVSVDSMQVYKGMDIGTAKPTLDEQRNVPHHCIDLVDPDREFTLAEFQVAARVAMESIKARGSTPLLVGGTGLYLQSLIDDLELPGQFPEVRVQLEAEPDTRSLHLRLGRLDPLAASRMNADNRRRVIRALEVTLGSGRPFSSFGPGVDAFPQTDVQIYGISIPSDENTNRIDARVDSMFQRGLVDEVAGLVRELELSRTARQALGYKEILSRLEHPHTSPHDSTRCTGMSEEGDGECGWGELRGEIKARTRRFARRQRAWFGRDPRIQWFDTGDDPRALLVPMLREWSNR